MINSFGDVGLPIIISTPHEEGHVVTIIGYAYDAESNTEYILCENTNRAGMNYREIWDFNGPSKSKCFKNNPAVTFKRR